MAAIQKAIFANFICAPEKSEFTGISENQLAQNSCGDADLTGRTSRPPDSWYTVRGLDYRNEGFREPGPKKDRTRRRTCCASMTRLRISPQKLHRAPSISMNGSGMAGPFCFRIPRTLRRCAQPSWVTWPGFSHNSKKGIRRLSG